MSLEIINDYGELLLLVKDEDGDSCAIASGKEGYCGEEHHARELVADLERFIVELTELKDDIREFDVWTDAQEWYSSREASPNATVWELLVEKYPHLSSESSRDEIRKCVEADRAEEGTGICLWDTDAAVDLAISQCCEAIRNYPDYPNGLKFNSAKTAEDVAELKDIIEVCRSHLEEAPHGWHSDSCATLIEEAEEKLERKHHEN